ncbi:MAG TPA: hypothetical protein VFT12_09080, partial [Thermoanaerobaculia bacterium]|nr:hypothetical protein [Thermoanaerobaculia bacterium]
MRRIFGSLLLFALPGVVQGAESGVEIRIDPPAPTSHTSFQATISGLWGDGCPPQAPVVSVSGGTIRISLSVSQHPCPIVPIRPVEWKETVRVGPLPPGAYSMEAVVPGTSFGVIARTALFVRDATPAVRVYPAVLAVTGVRVRIEAPSISGCPPNVSPCPLPIVEFNGVRATDVSVGNGQLVVTVPQLAGTGPVEVAVTAF